MWCNGGVVLIVENICISICLPVSVNPAAGIGMTCRRTALSRCICGITAASWRGKYAYVLTSGDCLVVEDDVVKAKIPANCFDWVQYVWDKEEIEQHRQQVIGNLQIRCGWCNKETDPRKDGFHLVHVAFGTSQERYCFCSDECYEAFRKMYPARVHRNCYERDCADCNLCLKRYSDEASEIRMLAKDYLKNNQFNKKD